MNDTVVLSRVQYGQLLTRLERIEKVLLSLIEPKKGTESWWRWADQKGLEDIEAGHCTRIKDKKELINFFSQL